VSLNLNPINYAVGLMTDAETSALHGLEDRKAQDLAELAIVVEHLRTYDVSHLGDDVEKLRVSVLADVEAALSTPRKGARKTAPAS
jgi:glycerate kinase